MQYWTDWLYECVCAWNFDLINHVEERVSWELTVLNLIKKLPSLCGSQIYCIVYKIPLLFLVLSQVISVHVLPSYILTPVSILYHPPLYAQVSRALPNRTLYAFLFIRFAACLADLILVIFGEQYFCIYVLEISNYMQKPHIWPLTCCQ